MSFTENEENLLCEIKHLERELKKTATLRDHFAMAALIGLSAIGAGPDPSSVAADAYALADAMIAERGKK